LYFSRQAVNYGGNWSSNYVFSRKQELMSWLSEIVGKTDLYMTKCTALWCGTFMFI